MSVSVCAYKVRKRKDNNIYTQVKEKKIKQKKNTGDFDAPKHAITG